MGGRRSKGVSDKSMILCGMVGCVVGRRARSVSERSMLFSRGKTLSENRNGICL